MKKIFLLLAVVGMTALQSCEGPEGIPGRDGNDGYSVESEVFELKNINFAYNATDGYNIYQTLNPQILASDVILIYRLAGTINASTPIWQSIPRTLFLTQGELDYDFDFSKQDFTIYAGGTYDLALTPSYIQNQTFRIVIIPGYFSGRVKAVDTNDYNAVIKAYNIDDSKVKILNQK
jgi:hypothetical protein